MKAGVKYGVCLNGIWMINCTNIQRSKDEYIENLSNLWGGEVTMKETE